MLNSSLVQAINDPEHYRRYGVFILARENDQHIRLTYPLIVLKNGYDMIVEFTRLHEFIPHNSVVINTTSGGTKKHYMMTTMLNYILVDHRPDFHITRFEDISHDMMQSFFTSYATENTIYGIPPMEETVKRCISTCAETMYNVACAMPNVFTSLSPDALLTTKTVMTSRGMQAICSPNFSVEIPATGHLHAMRDIPREVMEFMIPLLYAHAPHIAFGCIASLCAGLRIGEICNMRQPYASISKYGRGISLSYTGSVVTDVEIDLNHVYTLRSDNVDVGHIKKKRTQKVFQPFIPIFHKAMNMHLEWLQGHDYDQKYSPMMVDNSGMAMTEENFRDRFERFVRRYLIPALLQSDNPILKKYGMYYQTYGLSPHAFRHAFSVELVLHHCSIAEIQSWRGDTSPESAFAYLTHKGEFRRILSEEGARLLDILVKAGAQV